MSFTPIYRRPDLDALLRHQQRQEFDQRLIIVLMGNARPAPPKLSWWQRAVSWLFRRDRAEASFEQDQSWASDAEDAR